MVGVRGLGSGFCCYASRYLTVRGGEEVESQEQEEEKSRPRGKFHGQCAYRQGKEECRRWIRQRSKEVGSELTTEDEEDLDIQARVIFMAGSAHCCILRNKNAAL